MSPQRYQRRRTKGWTTPLDANGQRARYVGRGSRFGNPWAVIQTTDGWAVKWTAGPGQRPWTSRPTEFTRPNELAARAMAVTLYDDWIAGRPEFLASARELLAGRDLLCWCPLPEPGQPDHCHARVLLDIANPTTGEPR